MGIFHPDCDIKLSIYKKVISNHKKKHWSAGLEAYYKIVGIFKVFKVFF